MKIFWPVKNKTRHNVLMQNIIMGFLLCYESYREHERNSSYRAQPRGEHHLGADDKPVILTSLKFHFHKLHRVRSAYSFLPFGGFSVVCNKVNIKSVQALPWSKSNGSLWQLQLHAVLLVDVLFLHDSLIFDEKSWLETGSYEPRGY